MTISMDLAELSYEVLPVSIEHYSRRMLMDVEGPIILVSSQHCSMLVFMSSFARPDPGVDTSTLSALLN